MSPIMIAFAFLAGMVAGIVATFAFALTSAANGRAAQHIEPDPVRPVHHRPRFRVTSPSPGEA
jgi:hypothetical protein